MGNQLLDFVMALVRDPAVAARYAADPSGVLADAGLAGVTPADVGNLMPMVAESISTAGPGFGPAQNWGATDPNVWTSGAATAAFDAFGTGRHETGSPVVNSIDPPIRGAVHPPVEAGPEADADLAVESPDALGEQVCEPAWLDPFGGDAAASDQFGGDAAASDQFGGDAAASDQSHQLDVHHGSDPSTFDLF